MNKIWKQKHKGQRKRVCAGKETIDQKDITRVELKYRLKIHEAHLTELWEEENKSVVLL